MSEPERLTNLACYDGQPAVSPDGKFIAMVSTQSGEKHIWIYDTQDRIREPLTMNEGADERPSFSPDGQSIVFASRIEGQRDVWLIDQEEKLTQVTASETDEFSPCWTPDGESILFVRHDAAGYQICRVRRRNFGDVRVVVSDTSALDRPSTGGDVLVFQKKISGRWALFLAGLNGDNVRPFSQDSNSVHDPAVSPDGKFLACVLAVRGRDEIHVTPLIRYKPAPVTSSGTSHAYPSWHPDGRRLVWEETSNWNIKSIDVETQQDTVLVEDPADDHSPVVTEDGRYVVFSSNRSGVDRLYALHCGNQSVMPLTDETDSCTDPEISGNRLLFTSTRNGRRNVFMAYLIENDSGLRLDSVIQVTHDPVGASRAAFFRQSRDIVFVTERRGLPDVWIWEAATSRERPVTIDERSETEPCMAAADATVLFAADWAHRWSLWSAPVGGGLPLPLTKDKTPYGWDREPVVSPDGTHILFTRSWYDDADVWLMRAGGGEKSTRTLTKDNTDQEAHGRWFPDGRRVIYQAGRNTDVWEMDVTGLLHDAER